MDMTNTATRNGAALDSAPTSAPALPPPPKLRRRPALVAGAVIAICLGALLGAWAWTSTTNTQEVLAARTTIPRGTIIEADDLQRVRINADPALTPIAGNDLDLVIGQRAALDIAAGGILTNESTAETLLPPDGMSVVGVALTAGQVPGVPLQTGDLVRVVLTPGEGNELRPGAPVFSEAEVVSTRIDDLTGELVVDLLVSHADATTLATRVATGNVAIVLDSGEQ